MIDDCGHDNSMNLVRKFMDDHRLFHWSVVSHASNRGLSAARNTGIHAAKGDYLYFLDSDDAIEPNALEMLIDQAEKQNADLVVGGVKEIGFKHQMLEKLPEKLVVFHSKEQGSRAFFDFSYPVVAWNKLISSRLVQANDLYFEDGLMHEDLLWSFRVAMVANVTVLIPKVTYLYFFNNSSISSIWKEKNIRSYISILCIINACVKREYGALKRNPSFSVFLLKLRYLALENLFSKTIDLAAGSRRELFDELRQVTEWKYGLEGYIGFRLWIKKLVVQLPFSVSAFIFMSKRTISRAIN